MAGDFLFFLLTALGSALVTAVIILGLFFPWLRNLQRQLDSATEARLIRTFDLPEPPALKIPPMKALMQPQSSGLLTEYKFKAHGRTVWVMESHGKKVVKLEAGISNWEKEQLMRYLVSEGFVE